MRGNECMLFLQVLNGTYVFIHGSFEAKSMLLLTGLYAVRVMA